MFKYIKVVSETLQYRICWLTGYGGCPSHLRVPSVSISFPLMPSASDDIMRAKLTQHAITSLFIGGKTWGHICNRIVIVIAERQTNQKTCNGMSNRIHVIGHWYIIRDNGVFYSTNRYTARQLPQLLNQNGRHQQRDCVLVKCDTYWHFVNFNCKM